MGRPLNIWLAVIVLICGISLWFGTGATLPKIKQNPTPEKLSVSEDEFSDRDLLPNIHLLILNGTEEKGLARDFSLMVNRIGCVVQGTGNSPAKPWSESFLVNRRLDRARIKELANQLGGIAVIREFDGRSTEDAVLILGQDHAKIREKLHPRSLLGAGNE